MNIRVRNKTISYGSGFLVMFFLDVTCLLYFLLFALWCNLNNLWCNKNTGPIAHSYCFLKYLYVVAICQLITEIADCQKPKNIWRKFVLFESRPPILYYFFQDMKPEPHIFSNVQNWSEKCGPIGNVKIWLEFFSTSGVCCPNK
jgi:hypothetical protein